MGGRSSGVERNLAKVEVVGSNPIARSIFPQHFNGLKKRLVLAAVPVFSGEAWRKHGDGSGGNFNLRLVTQNQGQQASRNLP